MEEYLDLVDENDIVVGNKKRSEIYRQSLSNYRVINVFIRNSQGKLWIPRRTADRKIYPLALDFSVGGHVETGETYEETLRRETKEEINIDIAEVSLTQLGHFMAGEHGLSSFMKVYEIQLDETPAYNTHDFIEYYWLTPEELLQKIGEGEKAKSDLPILAKLLYSH